MKNTRRQFLKTTGGVMAASSILSAPFTIAAAQESENATETVGSVTTHELPPLPYPYDALAPHIDEETMRLHHDKHHQAYVDGLNAAEKALAEARAKGDYAYVQHWSKKLAFNGAGHSLHSLFWQVMAPPDNGGGGQPSGALAERIDRDFGSFETFKAAFSAASKDVEASGWGTLNYRASDDSLVIMQVENHQKLTTWNAMPILCLDVWEHAYYVSYRNRRADYITAWWNVVNWDQVAKNYDALHAARSTAS
jgi:Fe-Mn family superoxide dismutase